MNSVNRVTLLGNLGKDPELRTLDSGTKVVRFPMATNERYTLKNGDRVMKTEWHDIILWRAQAELAHRFLKKGSPVYVEGKLRSRSYTDKEGNNHYVTEVVAENFTLLSRNDQEQAAVDALETVAHENGIGNQPEPEGDLPF